MAKSTIGLKPGSRARISGQYRIGRRGPERTVVRGKRFPPTPKPGQRFTLVDRTTTYQPSNTELEKDMRVDPSFEEAAQALTRPVRIRYISRPQRTPS